MEIKDLTIKCRFYRTGYHGYGSFYRKLLGIEIKEPEEMKLKFEIGRFTVLARWIKKYILKDSLEIRRSIVKEISEREWKLLYIFKKTGPKYWRLIENSFGEKDPISFIEQQLFWRLC